MKNKIADIYDSSAQGIEKKHIPELRFPEFTGEWEEKTIEDIFRITRGLVLPMKSISLDKNEKNPYPVYSSQTLNNGLAGFYGDYLYENAITWTTDGANAGEVKFRRGKFYCTNVCGVLLSNEGYANECVAAIINSISKKYVSYVGNPKLMNNVMAKITIFLPPTSSEQQKIADCLSFIDEQILATQQKWDSLKEHKRGLMQKLFPANGKTTPDFRFPEFANAGEWEEKQLNTIGETLGGLSGKNAEDFGQGEPYVTYKQVFAGARIKFNDCQLVQILPNESQNKLQYGDVLITMSSETPNEIGYSAVVTSKPLKSYYLNSFCFIFRYKNSIAIDPLFSIYLFQSNLYRINVIRIAQGITRYNISPSKFLDIKLSFPSFAEQQKIAQCLSSVDEQILATQQKWDFLKEHKRGLMQRLFPNNDIDFKN